MKNFFVLLFLTIITISVVFFNALDNRPMRLKENARFLALQYFAQSCLDCRELNHKMHKINWLFGRKPINFLRYDLSNAQTIQQSETQLQNLHVLQPARQNQQLKQVIFFDLKTKKPVLTLTAQEDLIQMESKINRLLGE